MSVASENCVTSESRKKKIMARADLIPGMCIFSISDQNSFLKDSWRVRGCVLNADWGWKVFL
jgi:hypothetical protein